MPSPVRAETTTDPSCALRERAAAAAGARSALLITSSSGTSAGADLGQHRAHGVDLPLGVRRRAVDHVHEEVGLLHHLEGRAEGLDQLVGQLADEPDRVGHEHRLAAGQRQAPGPGVERREEAVLDQHPGVGAAG